MKWYEDRPEDRSWLERALGGKFTNNCKVLSYFSTNGVGFIAYDNITDISADISASGTGHWLSRSLLQHIFQYAFDVLKVKRINAYVQPDNKKSINLVTRLGFINECLLRGVDVYLFSLLPTDSRYYEKP